MKADNPQLTAFVLGELPPAEKAQLEQELRNDQALAAEIHETREIARILRAGLGAERGGELAPHQRDAIFREAELAQKERSLATSPSANEAFAPLIVPQSTWWDRPGPWQAVAACAVAGLAAYAMFINLGGHSRGDGSRDSGEIVVQLPTGGSNQVGTALVEPRLDLPNDRTESGNISSAGFGQLKPNPQTPKINGVSPVVSIETDQTLSSGSNLQTPGEPGTSPAVEPNSAKRRGAYALGPRNPQVLDRTGASIARPQKTSDTLTDELVLAYLKDRMAEIDGLQEGSSYAEFSKVFRPVTGMPGRYELIQTPAIKVDAEFAGAEGQPINAPPGVKARLKSISTPHLE